MEDYSFDDVEFKLEPNNKLFQMSLLNRKKDFEEVIKVIKDMDSDDSRFQTIAILTKTLYILLENTLYLGDLVVNFPDIVKTILIANHKWIETVFWCFNTIPKMEYLLDKPTIDVIKLAKEKLSFKN
ncbi:hypothetical protein M0802_003519 [Mischocyttarus mexicanus]|nr:hypothetical protein M0802_003519 [Mischocyttarus mexicanus]